MSPSCVIYIKSSAGRKFQRVSHWKLHQGENDFHKNKWWQKTVKVTWCFHLLCSPVGSLKCLEIWSSVFPNDLERKLLKAVVSKRLLLSLHFCFVFFSADILGCCLLVPLPKLSFPKESFFKMLKVNISSSWRWEQMNIFGEYYNIFMIEREMFSSCLWVLLWEIEEINGWESINIFSYYSQVFYDKCARWWN